MHHFVEQCVQSVDQVLEKAVNEKKDVELKTLMGNYTMDVIATCAVATKIDTHNDPNNPFILNGIKMFRGNLIRNIALFAFRPLMKLLNISLFDPNVVDFFKSAVSNSNSNSYKILIISCFLQTIDNRNYASKE